MIHIFIINPRAGLGMFSEQISMALSKRKDIEYYIFHTRKGFTEQSLVRQAMSLFEGEKLRFYCCGGQGTLRNMLNGFTDFNDVEIAFHPNGLTNDFLKVFGDEQELFSDINNLIDGRVIYVDYMKTNYGICLNTASMGKDASVIGKAADYDNFSILGRLVPFAIGMLGSIICCKPTEYEIEIDDEKYQGEYIEIMFGNGGTVGGAVVFDNNPDVFDGLGNGMFIDDAGTIKLFRIMSDLVKKRANTNKYINLFTAKKVVVRRKDGEEFEINQDGELSSGVREWIINIENKGLPFVVPKEVAKTYGYN